MKKNRKLLVGIGLVVLIGAFLYGICKRHLDLSLKDDNVISIGAILALTGPTSYFGEETKVGIEAAKVLLQENGITNIVVCYEDSAFATKTGLNAFKRLCATDALDGLIVAHSAIAQPIASLISNTREDEQIKFPVVMTALAFSPELTKGNRVCIRCFPSGIDEGCAMAKYINQALKSQVNKVVAVYPNDDYGIDASKSFVKNFEANGGVVVYDEPYDSESANQRSLAVKLVSYNPDAVYMIGATPAFANLLKELRAIGYKGYILAGTGMDVDNVRKSIGERAISDVIFTSVFADTTELMKNELYRRYKTTLSNMGFRPSMLNVYTAIAFMDLCESIHNSPGGTSIDRASQFSVAKKQSILGDVYYDADRGIKAPLFIKRTKSIDLDQDEFVCIIQ